MRCTIQKNRMGMRFLKEREYIKPMLHDLNEEDLQNVNGGGLIVVVGVVVAGLLVVAGYTVLAAGVTVNVAGAVNVAVGVNTVVA